MNHHFYNNVADSKHKSLLWAIVVRTWNQTIRVTYSYVSKCRHSTLWTPY